MTIPKFPVATINIQTRSMRGFVSNEAFETHIVTPEVRQTKQMLRRRVKPLGCEEPFDIEAFVNWTIPTEPEMLSEIRRLSAEIERLTPKVEAYRHLRMHVRKDGSPKIAHSEEKARRAADSLSSDRGGEYEGYECWCGSWHIGRLRTPKGEN